MSAARRDDAASASTHLKDSSDLLGNILSDPLRTGGGGILRHWLPARAGESAAHHGESGPLWPNMEDEMRIHELFLTAASAAFVTGAVLFSAGDAYAQECNNPSVQQCQEYCTSFGSAFLSCTKDGGAVGCLCEEKTKDVPGNAFGTATQQSEEGTGNFQDTGSDNKPEPQPCTGNQGQCKKQ